MTHSKSHPPARAQPDPRGVGQVEPSQSRLTGPAAAQSYIALAIQRAMSGAQGLIYPLEVELGADSSGDRSALLSYERARLIEAAGKSAAAIDAYRHARLLDPTLRSAFWALLRQATVSESWDDVARLLDEQLSCEVSPPERAALLLEKGWLLLDRFDRFDEAEVAFRESFEEGKQCTLSPLLALHHLRRAHKSGPESAALIEEISGVADGADFRSACLRWSATVVIQEKGGSGAEQALGLFRRALKYTSSETVTPALRDERRFILCEMAVLCVDTKSYEEYAATLLELARLYRSLDGQKQAVCDRHDLLACYVVVIDLLDRELGKADEAGAILAEAATLFPDSSLLSEMRILAADRSGNDAEFIRLTDSVPSDSGHPPLLAERSFRRALAHQRLGDHASALRYAQQTLEIDPMHLSALFLLERDALVRGDAQGLIDLALHEAMIARESLGEPGITCWAFLKAGMVAFYRVQDIPAARAYCEAALEAMPGFGAAACLYLSVLLSESSFDDAGALAERILLVDSNVSTDGNAMGNDASALVAQDRWVALAMPALDDPDRLLRALAIVRAKRPENISLIRHAVVASDHAEAWASAASSQDLERRLAEEEVLENDLDEKAHCALRRAELYAGPLDDKARARALYWQVLAYRPGHSIALIALEEILSREACGDELERLYRWGSEHSTLPQVREYYRAALSRSLTKDNIYHQAEDDAERVSRLFSEFRESLATSPGNLRAIRAFEYTALELGRHDDVVYLLKAEIETLDISGSVGSVALALAEYFEDHRIYPDEIVPLFEQALTASRIGSNLWFAAERALVRRDIQAKAWSEASLRLSRLTKAAPAKMAAAFADEQAWICAGPLNDTARSLEIWSHLLSWEGGHLGAHLEMMSAASQADDPETLAELSASWAERVSQGSPFADALAHRSVGLAGIAGSWNQPLWRKRLHAALDRSDDRVAMLFLLLAHADTALAERCTAIFELADALQPAYRESVVLAITVAYMRAGDTQAALKTLMSLLEHDKENLAAWLLCWAISAGRGRTAVEARILIRIAALLGSNTFRATICLRAGSLFQSAGCIQESIDANVCAAKLAPHDWQVIRAAYAALEKANALCEAEDVLSLSIPCAQSREQQIERLLLRGVVRRRREHLRAAAIDFMRVLYFDPEHIQALAAMVTIAVKSGDLNRSLAFYQRIVDLGGEQKWRVRRQALMTLLDLLEKKEQWNHAAIICQDFLESDRENDDTALRERVVAYYLRSTQPRRAIAVLEHLCRYGTAMPRYPLWIHELARVQMTLLENFEAAKETLLRALYLKPASRRMLQDLERICEKLGTPQDYLRSVDYAKVSLRRMLATRPLSAPIYRRLVELSEWSGDGRSLCAGLGVLTVLGSADDTERELYLRRVANYRLSDQSTLSETAWQDTVRAPSDRGPWGDLWRLVGAFAPQCYPGHVPTSPEAAAEGRVQPLRSISSVSPSIGQIRAFSGGLGGSAVNIWVALDQPDIIVAVDRNSATLVLGSQIVARFDEWDRFRVAMSVARLREGTAFLGFFSLLEIQSLLVAGVLAVEPGYRAAAITPEILTLSRSLTSMLTRPAYADLSLLVHRVLSKETVEIDEWVNAANATCVRAALMLSGNLPLAVRALIVGADPISPLGSENMVELLARDQNAQELCPFYVSRHFGDLHQMMGHYPSMA